MISIVSRVFLCVLSLAVATPILAQSDRAGAGSVVVRGRELLRDGERWIPHGFYQIAFEVAPGNFSRADHAFWRTAYNNYTSDEYRQMRAAGADSVRVQISQAAADRRSDLFDGAFLQKSIGAIHAARAAGLIVIVCLQGETHVPGEKPLELPDDGTRRVWREIAPEFARDQGVLIELLNEPQPKPNAQNWGRWLRAMMETLRTVRETGAPNVIIADGLEAGQVLAGAPLLDDPQVAYASHPYASHGVGQKRGTWDAKFGRFSQRAPVIITEWLSGGYYCDRDTPKSTVEFLHYLQNHGIGLEVGIWDWAPGGFGSVRWNFPDGKFSSFSGLACHQPGYGLGKVIETWYTTGAPPDSPE